MVAPDIEECTIKVLRIRKAIRGKSNPMKFVFQSEAVTPRVSEKFSKEKAASVDEAFADI